MKDFWRQQVKKHGSDIESVNFDPLAEQLELHFLKQFIKQDEIVCDMGCGNGRTLLFLARKFKKTKFIGIDYVEEMIIAAKKQQKLLKIPNITFLYADAISQDVIDLFGPIKFDKVFTKRLLVNLKGEDKKKAIKNTYSILKKRGTYIMIECFLEPLKKINKIRKELDLENINVKHFNEYLSYQFLGEINNYFNIEKKIDFGSLYYFMSRVFNASLTKGKPDYFAPINQLAVYLTKKGFNVLDEFSPEQMFILSKK